MTREAYEPTPAGGGDRFPWIVALGALVIGAWIFFTSTVPAIRERETLDEQEQILIERRDSMLDATTELRDRRKALSHSQDHVLVELDRHGLHPSDPEIADIGATTER
ncbi:MAG: hypothetical protein KDB80_16465 [Planctomycetes bacterium]|nr:hypothetical protein [Planctomycetota bacterium]